MIKLYRAMCKEEYIKTYNIGKPSFFKKHKWFSLNLQWVKQRVQNEKFNNSNFIKTRYTHLCEFNWDGNNADFISKNEIQFNVRKNPKIKFIKLISVKK